MQTTIQKWGNSLGLRIPKAFAEEAGVEAGSAVDLAVRDGGLVVTPVRNHRYVLQDLLDGITRDNKHEEIDSGAAVGREAW